MPKPEKPQIDQSAFQRLMRTDWKTKIARHKRAPILESLIGLVCVVLILRMINVHETYDVQMPRNSQPELGRTLPVVAVNNVPVYVTPEEKRNWEIIHYEGWAGLALMIATAVFLELWNTRKKETKKKEKQGSRLIF